MSAPVSSTPLRPVRPARRWRRTALIALIAGTALTPAAQAAVPTIPVEVLSRATGAAGGAPLGGLVTPGAVSPDGRRNVFTVILDGKFILYSRDIVTNTTREIARTPTAGAAGGFGVTGIDAGGRVVSFITGAKLDPADTDALPSLYAHDLVSGHTALVSRRSGAAGASIPTQTGIVAGQGTSVVFVEWTAGPASKRVFRRDLKTGVTTQLSVRVDDGHSLTSVSDDGRALATASDVTSGSGSQSAGTYATAAGLQRTAGAAWLSADGSTVAWVTGSFGETQRLHVRRLTGSGGTVVTDVAASAPGTFNPSRLPIWIAPDGSQVALAQDYYDGEGTPILVWNRTTGKFAELDNQVARQVTMAEGVVPGRAAYAVSRSGRFLQLPDRALWVADLWGRGLPGGSDTPPPTVYVIGFNGGGLWGTTGPCGNGQLALLVSTQALDRQPVESVFVRVRNAAGQVVDLTVHAVQGAGQSAIPLADTDTLQIEIIVRYPGGKVTRGRWTHPYQCFGGAPSV